MRVSRLPAAYLQVIGRLGEASNPKARAKLQQLLQAAVQGVLANDSVSPSDLLIFIHSVLEAGVAAEEGAQAAAQAFAEAPGNRSLYWTHHYDLGHILLHHAGSEPVVPIQAFSSTLHGTEPKIAPQFCPLSANKVDEHSSTSCAHTEHARYAACRCQS